MAKKAVCSTVRVLSKKTGGRGRRGDARGATSLVVFVQL